VEWQGFMAAEAELEVRDGIEPPMRVLQTLLAPWLPHLMVFGVLFGLYGLLLYLSAQNDGLSDLL
jgi:hypothetical protein